MVDGHVGDEASLCVSIFTYFKNRSVTVWFIFIQDLGLKNIIE